MKIFGFILLTAIWLLVAYVFLGCDNFELTNEEIIVKTQECRDSGFNVRVLDNELTGGIRKIVCEPKEAVRWGEW